MKKILFLTLLIVLAASAWAGPRVVVHRHWARPVVVAPAPMVVTVKPAVGWVDINCNVDDAAVLVNGAFAGVADQFDGFPRKLELKPGTYRIKLVFAGRAIERRVIVTRGREINLNVAF